MGTEVKPPEYQYNEIHSDDEDISHEDQEKLKEGISQIYKSQRIEAPKRSEPIREVSEYNLSAVDHKKHQDESVNVFNLLAVLKEKAPHREIIEKVKKIQKKSKILPRPVEKIHAEKISRTLGYENVKNQLNRWNSVVQKNKVASQLKFPLEQQKVELKIAPDRITHFKVPSDLERAMAAILQESQIAQEDKKEEEELKGLSIEEIIERRRMIGKLRAKESYRIAKAVRQNKIKSKKYHRVLKREKIKKELKEFERLQKEDPEAALEKLEQLERMRAEERISLRHKNTGKWARSQAIRAKYDPQARIQLAEQLAKSRDLTRKLKKDGESSSEHEELEEDEVEEPQKAGGQDNPWNVQKKAPSDVETFLGGYRKFWADQNKKEQEKIDESTEKQRIEDEKIIMQRYKEALNGFVQGSVLDSLKGKDALETIIEEGKTDENVINVEHSDKINGDTSSSNSDSKTQEDIAEAKVKEAADVRERKKGSFSEKKKEKTAEILSNSLKSISNSTKAVSSSSKAVSNSPKAVSSSSKAVSNSPKAVSSSPKTVSNSPKAVSSSSNAVSNSPKAVLNCSRNDQANEVQSCNKTNKLSSDEKLMKHCEDFKNRDENDSSNSSEVDEVSLSNHSLDEPIVKRTRYALSSKNRRKKPKIISITNSGVWEVTEQCQDSNLDKNKLGKSGQNIGKSINDIFENTEEYLSENVKKSVEAIRNYLSEESGSDIEADNSEGNSSKLNTFEFKKKIRRSDMDEELLEVPMDGISSGQNNLRSIKDKLVNNNVNGKSEKETSEAQINPNIFMKAVSMESAVPDLEEGGDTDSEDEKIKRNRASHMEAFAEDDIDEEFRQEKEDESKKSAAKEINLELPGWGSWGGPNMSQGPRNRRKRRRLVLNLPRLPRKDERKERVIINEDPVSKLKEHLVSELPYPFTSVKDYEASIRAPLGKTWVTETAHKKLTAPPVITKMGTIIDPIDEAQLFNPSKRENVNPRKKSAQKK